MKTFIHIISFVLISIGFLTERSVPLDPGMIRVGPGGDFGYTEPNEQSINRAIMALKNTGGTVVITAGRYAIRSPISLRGCRALNLVGEKESLLIFSPAPVVPVAIAAKKGDKTIYVATTAGLLSPTTFEIKGQKKETLVSAEVSSIGSHNNIRLRSELKRDIPVGASLMQTDNCILIFKSYDCSLVGLSIDMQKNEQPFVPRNHSRHCAIYCGGQYDLEAGTSLPCTRISIIDCTIWNAEHRGIAAYAIEDLEIRGCRIENTGAEAINIDHFCRKVQVEDNDLVGGDHLGIELNDVSEVSVKNNRIHDFKIGIRNWHYQPCRMPDANVGIAITGNHISKSRSFGIWIGKTCDNNTITGNNIIKGKGMAMFIGAQNIDIQNNSIEDTDTIEFGQDVKQF